MIKKILTLIAGSNKFSIYFIIFLVFAGSIFEMLSLGAIIPILSLFLDDQSDFFLNEYLEKYFPWINDDNFMLVFISLFFFIFFLRYIFLVYLSLKINLFIYSASRLISQKLLKIYLSKKYYWHTGNNKSYFINLMINETANFSSNGLYGFLFIIAELFFFLSIVIFLVFFNPNIFLTIVLLGAIFFPLLVYLTKRFSYNLGLKRQKFERQILLNLNESLQGIKEMILYNWSDKLKDRYGNLSLGYVKVSATHNSLQDLGRHTIEIVGVILVIIFFYILILNEPGDAGLITAGIFGAAIFKLMPILNRISTFAQRYRFGIASADKIIEFLNYEEVVKKKTNIDFTKNIELKNIYHNFENENSYILENINLKIKKNEIIGICGESGSGKTTITNLIMGLLEPTKGQIIVDGKDIHKNSYSIQNKISFVPQNFLSLDASVIDNITFFDKKINYQNLKFCLKNSLLTKLILNKTLSLKSNIGNNALKISGGQLQRLNIARALYRNPKILILDEPTSSLDKNNLLMFGEIMKKLKKKMTIVIISHNLELLEFCESKYILKNKNLLEFN